MISTFKSTPITKPRLATCKICAGKYQRTRPLQSVCLNIACAVQHGRNIAAKKERANDKARKEMLEPLEYFLKQAECACNAYVLVRDADLPCISCGRSDATVWNAGHYVSVGSNRTIRFNPDNVNKQCARPCNLDLSGNVIKYRQGLVKKIGVERVEALESWHAPEKMTKEKALVIKAEYKLKLKELLKAGD